MTTVLTKHQEFIASQCACDPLNSALGSFTRWALAVASSGTHHLNPYHNMTHTRRVVDDSIRIYQHETGEPATPELIFAAYMHDYNHSGGRHPDVVNIERALAGVDKFSDQPRLRNVDLTRVRELIACTYFDGTGFPVAPNGVEACALRDADLLELYSDDAPHQLSGLFAEMRPAGNWDMTPNQYLERSYAFLKNATMYTTYGNRVKNDYLDVYFYRLQVALSDIDMHAERAYDNAIRGTK